MIQSLARFTSTHARSSHNRSFRNPSTRSATPFVRVETYKWKINSSHRFTQEIKLSWNIHVQSAPAGKSCYSHIQHQTFHLIVVTIRDDQKNKVTRMASKPPWIHVFVGIPYWGLLKMEKQHLAWHYEPLSLYVETTHWSWWEECTTPWSFLPSSTIPLWLSPLSAAPACG